ncbi:MULTISPECIES: stage V sporulation protein AD [unclassified Oceanobacillus]|uniref:stage V sporulation protein AD n=1 Tax=unclassified Oceanobacillus TaxID=2630292 RepID=UPI0012EB0CE9|nr:stage V sporulation protein AD [Oceanobacillus sp. AG]
MLLGKQTWEFKNRPVILATGITGGPFEADGPLRSDFDHLFDDGWLEEETFEKAQQRLMEVAVTLALKKSPIEKEQVNFFISGDLINQITPTTFSAKSLAMPYLGLFSACATSTEGLALSAALLDGGFADFIVSGSASHHAAAEKQFRYPNDYGSQKPPTAQWTVTGAGCAVLSKQGNGPTVTSATIGKVVDMGITDPFNMGGAMAPAAVETIQTHFKERNVDETYYDLIITGDLGKIGRNTSFDLLKQQGIQLEDKQYVDCGMTIYGPDQPVQAGASGTACSAIVMYGHFLKRMMQGEFKRMLLVATGSLHSPLSVQQKDSIPAIAHAVSIEME